MSEEENGEVQYTETELRIEPVDAGSLSEASRARVVFETTPRLAMEIADVILTYLKVMYSGQLLYARDGQGNDVLPQLQPEVIDPLATGDDPAE